MRHASLFSGIGGFDLAAQWVGWENIFQVEIDPYATKVLEKNFPDVKRYKDIYDLNAEDYEYKIDIISGGFPCQPFSSAGKRESTRDNRYLWPQMLRIIKECKPSWVVAENVYGILNIDGGMVFQQVCLDLEAEGYAVQPFIIPACGKDAHHRRDRVWFIGYNVGYAQHDGWSTKQKFRGNEKTSDRGRQKKQKKTIKFEGADRPIDATSIRSSESRGKRAPVADAKGGGTRGVPHPKKETGSRHSDELSGGKRRLSGADEKQAVANAQRQRGCGSDTSGKDATHAGQPPRSEGPGFWVIEPDVGRVANGVPKRVDRLKGLGNAIVPQLAYEIFKSIAFTIKLKKDESGQ